MHLHATIAIEADPARVWEVLTDVERYPQWTTSMTGVERLDPGPLRPASRVRITQPRLPTTVWTVDDIEPEQGFTWSSRTRGITTVAGHRLNRPVGGPLTVTLTIDQHGPLAPVVALLAGRLTRRYLRLETVGLRAESERP